MAYANVRPVSERSLKLNAFCPCLGQNFPPRGGKFRWVFGEAPRKGCLQTFEELPQKDTLVLPQAKCSETSRCFCNLPASSSKGFGETFSERRFPRVPRIHISLRKGNIFGRIISSPTSHFLCSSSLGVWGTFSKESPLHPSYPSYPPYLPSSFSERDCRRSSRTHRRGLQATRRRRVKVFRLRRAARGTPQCLPFSRSRHTFRACRSSLHATF